MKVTSFLLLFVAFIALVNAQQTGSTGAATGPEPSKAEEAKVEKAKKEEMEHTVANQKASQITEIKKVVANAITDTNKYAGEQKAASGATGSTGITNSVEEVFDGQAQ